MIDRVESLRKIDGSNDGPLGWFWLIKSGSNLRGQWKKCGGGGARGGKAMLGRVTRKRGKDERTNKPLKGL